MPKKSNPHRVEARKRRWANGEQRKLARRQAANAAHSANLAAGKTPRRQTRRRKADNMRVCLRCTKRLIVAGSVCWCAQIGAV
jgi:hypothetical protein